MSNIVINHFNKLSQREKLISSLVGLFGLYKIVKLIQKKKLVLKNKFVVVTGASSGIGLELSKELAKNECRVILIARSEDKLKNTVDEISKTYGNNNCHYVCADLSKEEGINKCKLEIQSIVDTYNDTTFGYVEVLINCAGAGQWKFMEETSSSEVVEMMALPYFAAFNITKLLVDKMILNGSGLIVNLNSPVSMYPWAGCIGYACSRFAFRGFTQCLKTDLQDTGVKVLEVIPGETKSEYFENNGIGRDHFPLLSSFVPKISPEFVAKKTVSAIINRKERVVIPLSLDFAKYFVFYPFSLLLGKALQSENSKKRLSQIKLKQQQYQQEKLKQQQIQHNPQQKPQQ